MGFGGYTCGPACESDPRTVAGRPGWRRGKHWRLAPTPCGDLTARRIRGDQARRGKPKAIALAGEIEKLARSDDAACPPAPAASHGGVRVRLAGARSRLQAAAETRVQLHQNGRQERS